MTCAGSVPMNSAALNCYERTRTGPRLNDDMESAVYLQDAPHRPELLRLYSISRLAISRVCVYILGSSWKAHWFWYRRTTTVYHC
eukprot:6480601-Amphidinium_carterae.2